MVLQKKYVVQKSFRIDAKLEEDLEQLSETLNRSQNDLVNLALERLMEDNQIWFAKNILVDYCEEYFEHGSELVEFSLGRVTISICVNDDSTVTFKGSIRSENGEEIIDSWDTTYNEDQNEEEDIDEKLKNRLRQIALMFLVNDDQIIDKYLRQRLNYR